jgi:hypothetical protein
VKVMRSQEWNFMNGVSVLIKRTQKALLPSFCHMNTEDIGNCSLKDGPHHRLGMLVRSWSPSTGSGIG